RRRVVGRTSRRGRFGRLGRRRFRGRGRLGIARRRRGLARRVRGRRLRDGGGDVVVGRWRGDDLVRVVVVVVVLGPREVEAPRARHGGGRRLLGVRVVGERVEVLFEGQRSGGDGAEHRAARGGADVPRPRATGEQPRGIGRLEV